jgi:hypothetical protein
MKTDGPPGRPLGGVGGRSSLTDAIHVSEAPAYGVGGSSSSFKSELIGLPRGVDGGRGWINFGTMTLSLPRTKIAPALLAVPQ